MNVFVTCILETTGMEAALNCIYCVNATHNGSDLYVGMKVVELLQSVNPGHGDAVTSLHQVTAALIVAACSNFGALNSTSVTCSESHEV